MRNPNVQRKGRLSQGFTLIEVLGAVAVLAILYTMLAGVAIQALRAEGESQRRMEASLIASERLSTVEAASAMGSAPPPGEESEQVEIFNVETQVRPVEQGTLGFGDDPEDQAVAALLFPPDNGSASAALVEIEILVTWSEGDREMEVRRTTYAMDSSGFGGLFGAGFQGGGEDSLGDDSQGSRGRGDNRSSDRAPSTARVDCNTPCPDGDINCLMQQMSQCAQ